jgi:hypothetical protein
MQINRSWAMPHSDTFSVPPIGEFVKKYLANSKVSVDPFARNKEWATYTNDLNTETSAQFHLDALEFMEGLAYQNVKADLVIFDPPYSPRQLAECYKQVGRKETMQDTQSKSWSDWKNAISNIISENGIVLSFGWNTVGMGKTRGFEILEILMVCHGGMHNDTICLAETHLTPRAVDKSQPSLL